METVEHALCLTCCYSSDIPAVLSGITVLGCGGEMVAECSRGREWVLCYSHSNRTEEEAVAGEVQARPQWEIRTAAFNTYGPGIVDSCSSDFCFEIAFAMGWVACITQREPTLGILSLPQRARWSFVACCPSVTPGPLGAPRREPDRSIGAQCTAAVNTWSAQSLSEFLIVKHDGRGHVPSCSKILEIDSSGH